MLVEHLRVSILELIELHLVHLLHLKKVWHWRGASHWRHHLHHQKIICRITTWKQVIYLYCALTKQILHQNVSILLLITLKKAVALEDLQVDLGVVSASPTDSRK